MRNSLYGKHVQRKEGQDWLLSNELPDEYTPAIDGVTGEIFEMLGYKDIERSQPHMMPAWGVWILDNARMALTQAIYAVGPEHCYQGDTDSIFGDRKAIEKAVADTTLIVGKAYGEFKIEAYCPIHNPYAPKVYDGWERLPNGTWRHYEAHKGIPDRVAGPSVMTRYKMGLEPVLVYNSVTKPMRMLTHGLPSVISRQRSLTNIGNSFAWRVFPDRSVRPIILEE
jgi:hypothetical protein